MPLAFLTQQMEWRESVVAAKAAKDEVVLKKLKLTKHVEEEILFSHLSEQLAVADEMSNAKDTVRKLRFLEKLGEEIDDAVVELEN